MLFDGSTGFSYVSSARSLGARPVIFGPHFAFLGYSGIADPLLRRDSVPAVRTSGSMILPGRHKRFHVPTSINERERENFWNCLWDQARKALERAAEIVLIGYSLPAADTRARQLLLGHLNSGVTVSICSRGDSARIAAEFRDAGFECVETRAQDFGAWLGL